ncbi:unnamed protein product, partial [Nesidiocoris tenuis]
MRNHGVPPPPSKAFDQLGQSGPGEQNKCWIPRSEPGLTFNMISIAKALQAAVIVTPLLGIIHDQINQLVCVQLGFRERSSKFCLVDRCLGILTAYTFERHSLHCGESLVVIHKIVNMLRSRHLLAGDVKRGICPGSANEIFVFLTEFACTENSRQSLIGALKKGPNSGPTVFCSREPTPIVHVGLSLSVSLDHSGQVTVDVGEFFELKCVVSGGQRPSVTWLKDANPVMSSAAQPQLLYRFIQQTVQPGPAMSLKCIATGNPTPHITWTLDGFALPSNNERLNHAQRYPECEFASTICSTNQDRFISIGYEEISDPSIWRSSGMMLVLFVCFVIQVQPWDRSTLPPKWKIEPKDVNITKDGTAVFECVAEGFPLPATTWKKIIGQGPSEYQDLDVGRLGYALHDNGTLVIKPALPDHQGQYLCEASNGVGSGISSTVTLVVN